MQPRIIIWIYSYSASHSVYSYGLIRDSLVAGFITCNMGMSIDAQEGLYSMLCSKNYLLEALIAIGLSKKFIETGAQHTSTHIRLYNCSSYSVDLKQKVLSTGKSKIVKFC